MAGRGGGCKKIIIKKIDVDITIISHRRPKRRASPGFPRESHREMTGGGALTECMGL